MSRYIDLSHTIEHGMTTGRGLPPPAICDFLSFEDSRALYAEDTEFHIGRIDMVGSTGTYLDVPFHRFREGRDLSALRLDEVVDLPAVVVRTVGRPPAGGSPRTGAPPHAENPPVAENPPGAAAPPPAGPRAVDRSAFDGVDVAGRAVLVHTGWSANWGAAAYLEGHRHLTREAAEFLRDSGAALVGIDSMNIDDTADGLRPVHTILLGAGIPIVENLRGLELLPDAGFRFTAVPVKVRGFGSFPVRAFATGP